MDQNQADMIRFLSEAHKIGRLAGGIVVKNHFETTFDEMAGGAPLN